MLTQAAIYDALKTVKYPGYSRDIVTFGLVKQIDLGKEAVAVQLELTTPRQEVAAQIRAACEKVLRELPGIQQVRVEVKLPEGETAGAASPNPWANQARVPGLKHVVAIASGKGGVGKTTVAVNLTCALQQSGQRVGLLDCDIYGPSVPLMMGIRQRPEVIAEEILVPPANFGIKLMSIGFLLDDDQPVIWRGPMLNKAIQQFLRQVAWGELDYLIVDLPPGTGDAQLTLCQTVPLDGGIVVTTPQEASLGVVRKGIAMFERVNVPVLGLIENMSYFTTPTGERVEIFGHGGGQAEAKHKGLPFLGEIPIFCAIRIGGDAGVPVVIANPSGAEAQPFFNIAKAVLRRMENA